MKSTKGNVINPPWSIFGRYSLFWRFVCIAFIDIPIDAATYYRPVTSDLEFVVTMGTQCGRAVTERSFLAGNTNAIMPAHSNRKVYMETLKSRTLDVISHYIDPSKAVGGDYDSYFASHKIWRWADVNNDGTNVWINDIHTHEFPHTSIAALAEAVPDFPYEDSVSVVTSAVPGWFAGHPDVFTLNDHVYSITNKIKTWFDYTPYRNFGDWGLVTEQSNYMAAGFTAADYSYKTLLGVYSQLVWTVTAMAPDCDDLGPGADNIGIYRAASNADNMASVLMANWVHISTNCSGYPYAFHIVAGANAGSEPSSYSEQGLENAVGVAWKAFSSQGCAPCSTLIGSWKQNVRQAQLQIGCTTNLSHGPKCDSSASWCTNQSSGVAGIWIVDSGWECDLINPSPNGGTTNGFWMLVEERNSQLLSAEGINTTLASRRVAYLSWNDPTDIFNPNIEDENSTTWDTGYFSVYSDLGIGSDPREEISDFLVITEPYGGPTGIGKEGFRINNAAVVLKWDVQGGFQF